MKFITNALLILWFALYEVIFIAIALLTKLHPTVLSMIFLVGQGCNVLWAHMSKFSPYERPIMYNSEIFTTALTTIGMFSYLAVIVLFFIEWRIALIALAVGLILGGFFKSASDILIARPLYIMYAKLVDFARKRQ